jgi:HNH endonuclease.
MRQRSTEPVDPRSTQRKRARKTLFESGCPYICGEPHNQHGCGKSPPTLPKDAPVDLELAVEEFRTVSGLQANHRSKNIMDNDIANLEWLCPSCHKNIDKQTEKGVSVVKDTTGYLDGFSQDFTGIKSTSE